MKLSYYVLLIFVCLVSPLAGVSDKTMNELTVKIREVSLSGSVSVEVGNASSKPLRIWKESNSWGAARWRVLLIRGGQLETFFQNPDQSFTRNVPGFDEIVAGEHVEKKFDLNDGNWRGLDRAKIAKVVFQPRDTVIVIYDVPEQFGWSEASVADATRKMGVWYGVATALTTVQ